MSHFYDTSKGEAVLSESTTAPQARKAGHYPSVTTVLGIQKDSFIDFVWKPKKLVELAREHPDLPPNKISELTYGTVTCASTGDEIPSSQFGTTVHARLEGYVKGETMDFSEYDSYATPFLNWMAENSVKPKYAEFVAYNDDIRLAGSIDFVGIDSYDEYILADYKCRSCKSSGKGKFYTKDCSQLAIEAWMFARMHNLNYLPKCISICIDIDSKEHYHKVWSDLDCYKGILRAKLLATLYWMDFMNEDIGHLQENKKGILRDEIDMTIQILHDLNSIYEENDE